MSATVETYVIDGEAIALDLLIWRRYRRATPGLVEQTYALNPGLADLGPLIPRGTVIQIPLDAPKSYKQTPVVRLW